MEKEKRCRGSSGPQLQQPTDLKRASRPSPGGARKRKQREEEIAKQIHARSIAQARVA